MGTWGTQPWDNDDASDWFAEFFEGIDVDARIASALEYDDEYGQIRAACYMLNALGRTYTWPGDIESLNQHLELGIQRLANMLETDSEFHELWEDNEEVLEAVASELATLRERLTENTVDDSDNG